MNAKKRYTVILLSVIFLVLCYFGRRKFRRKAIRQVVRKSFWEYDDYFPQRANGAYNEQTESALYRQYIDLYKVVNTQCRMETCFDFSKCEGRPFKVYVYPLDDNVPPSVSYMKIINSVLENRYYTSNPAEACLFVLALDTLDRDPLSQDFVRNMQARVERLEHWNNGLNHIIYNLYSGTWPDYTETLSFDIGKAILAKASISNENYRPGFDISLPLFHKHHPEKGGKPGFVKSMEFPVVNKHFLAFKGKRYVHGIGSDTRNSLHHLHNGADVVMVTTCKHGKNWREMMDERCEEDNAEYDRWDYENLLANSTFCMVPRGRRLGSFRFLETLQAGCLPVILSNGWQLPFGEVLDWSAASILADERQLLQVPEMLHSLSPPRIFYMRQQTQVLWDRYLSSVEKIVDTTLEIMFQRIHTQLTKEARIWNTSPGALLTHTLDRYSGDPSVLVPYGYSSLGALGQVREDSRNKLVQIKDKFTAVIRVSARMVSSSSPVFWLIRNIALSPSVASIVVLWTSQVKPPPLRDWTFLGGLSTNTSIPSLTILTSRASRFMHASHVSTQAVLSLDDDISLTTTEIDFAFQVWLQFPERIVGFPSRGHFWDDMAHKWVYSSKWSNEYSMVLATAAFLHTKYALLYLETLPRSLSSSTEECEHILVNFLVSHVTKRPPIMVTHRKNQDGGAKNLTEGAGKFHEKQDCINTFVAGFGYMPLVSSKVRLDPVLFKDPVSNLRKKYRKMELVQ